MSTTPASLILKPSTRRSTKAGFVLQTLAQVVRPEEQEAQERTKPEHPKQLHLTLDANLTVQTRRRYLSSMPSSIEELRKKYWVMTQMWLLDQDASAQQAHVR